MSAGYTDLAGGTTDDATSVAADGEKSGTVDSTSDDRSATIESRDSASSTT